MPKTYTFLVDDIRCYSCAKSIENALQKNVKTKSLPIEIDVTEKKLKIKADNLSHEEIKEIQVCLTEAGFDSEYEVEADKKTNQTRRLIRNYLFKGIVGLFCGIVLLLLCILPVTLPLIAVYIIAGVTSLLTLYLGSETYFQAIKKFFKTQSLTMDTLFAISTLVALAVSIAALFVPWLPILFSAPLLIFGFRYIGKAIEESAKKAVFTGLTFRERVPPNVTLIDNEKRIVRAISTIKSGDVIVVEPDQIIPLNGNCIEASTVYDTIITGSPLPRIVKKGECVLAGMRASEKTIIGVTADEKASYLAQLDAELQAVNNEKAPIEMTANAMLRYFIPLVLVLAVISALCIGIFFSPALAIQCFIAVLVSACPCTLGFIVPLSVKIGISKAMDYGVQFKSGKSLQMAQQIDTVVFDLNGTLTNGTPKVREVHVCEGYSDKQVLAYFRALEQGIRHPIAQAIYSYADQVENLRIENPIQENNGVQACINGETYTVGDETMMRQKDINTEKFSSINGQHVIFLARGKEIISYVVLHDPLRKNAKFVIDELKKMGKQVYICTGSPHKTANDYARELGIDADHVAENRVGIDGDNTKLNYIKMLQDKQHKVAMIGDGGNDALAVTACDLGVAIKSPYGEKVTQNRANVTIKSTSLMPILAMFSVADQSVTHIKQNLAASLTYNILVLLIACGLLVAIGFTLNPGIGVALMILQMSLVLLNAYRFKCSSPHPALKNIENTISEEDKPAFNMPNVFNFEGLNSVPNPSKGVFYSGKGENSSELSLDVKGGNYYQNPVII